MKNKILYIYPATSLQQGFLYHALSQPEDDANNRLFITVHHLAIDGVSWRILLEDWQRCISSIEQGVSIDLGNKSSSYREWYDALEDYSQLPLVEGQLGYWQHILENEMILPLDYPTGKITGATMNIYSIELEESYTRSLLQEVHQAYDTMINDILLCGLLLAMKDWTGEQDMVIGLEGHGREDLFKTIDLSHTVGWFTNLYPVHLSTDGEISLGDIIKSVKRSLGSIPDQGMGYGALRYLHPSKEIRASLESLTVFDMMFNYLGQFDNIVASGGVLSGASESSGMDVSLENSFSTKLTFNGMIIEGSLRFTISYSTSQFDTQTIEDLGKGYKQNLESIIDHCKNKDTSKDIEEDVKEVDIRKSVEEVSTANMNVNGEKEYDEVKERLESLKKQVLKNKDKL